MQVPVVWMFLPITSALGPAGPESGLNGGSGGHGAEDREADADNGNYVERKSCLALGPVLAVQGTELIPHGTVGP